MVYLGKETGEGKTFTGGEVSEDNQGSDSPGALPRIGGRLFLNKI